MPKSSRRRMNAGWRWRSPARGISGIEEFCRRLLQ
jgi:hypothetical protein